MSNQITSRIRFSIGVLTATLTLTSQLPKADAALIPNIVTDKVAKLEVLWSWDPEGDAFSALGPDSTPKLENWFVQLTIDDNANPDLWSVNVDVRHIADPPPHPDLGEGLGDMAIKNFTFNKNEFGLVLSESFTANHPPIHKDFYTFTFDRSMAPSNTVIKLTGAHPVPESTSTLSLLALGTLGAVSTLKHQLKPSQSTEKDNTK